MGLCATNECKIQKYTGNNSYNFTHSISNTDDDNNSIFSTSSFKVVFPIVSVIGVFTLVLCGVVIQRILVKAVRKRWHSRRNVRHVTPENERCESGRDNGVNTVSRNYFDLPSYREAMASIEREEAPPPYYEVASGTVNLGFLGDYGSRSHVQSPSNEFTTQYAFPRITRNRLSINHTDERAAVEVIHANSRCEDRQTMSRGREELAISFQNRTSFLGNELMNNATTVGPSVYRSHIPPLDQPMSIVIHDIDEVTSPTSASNVLPTQCAQQPMSQNFNLTQKKKVQERVIFSEEPSNTSSQCTKPS